MAREVAGEDELVEIFALAGEAELSEMGKKSAAVLASLRGATDVTCAEIERCLMGDPPGAGCRDPVRRADWK